MGRPAKRPARQVLPRNRPPWRRPEDRKLETCKLNDVDPQAGSPTYWRDCATTPRVGSSKCCRGIEKPPPGNRDPPIVSPRSACGAAQMYVRRNARRVLLTAFN